MKQKQTILGVLTIVILIVIGLRFAGYREYIPSPLLWGLVAAQLIVSYAWKPKTP
jgi:MFS superfamily sulfate permease-like transporter